VYIDTVLGSRWVYNEQVVENGFYIWNEQVAYCNTRQYSGFVCQLERPLFIFHRNRLDVLFSKDDDDE